MTYQFSEPAQPNCAVAANEWLAVCSWMPWMPRSREAELPSTEWASLLHTEGGSQMCQQDDHRMIKELRAKGRQKDGKRTTKGRRKGLGRACSRYTYNTRFRDLSHESWCLFNVGEVWLRYGWGMVEVWLRSEAGRGPAVMSFVLDIRWDNWRSWRKKQKQSRANSKAISRMEGGKDTNTCHFHETSSATSIGHNHTQPQSVHLLGICQLQ